MTHERFSNPFTFDMALSDPIFRMVHRGIKISKERQQELFDKYIGQWKQAQLDLALISGKNINVNSPPQVRQWLFKDLGLPPRYHKKKVSTREDKLRAVLAECLEKDRTLSSYAARERWIVGALSIIIILRIRNYRKRLSSYIGLNKSDLSLSNHLVDSDGRMRQQLRIGGTETGRFSSSKTPWGTGCNMQTIPRELRSMFVADEGKVLCEFDLNRGESWVYAHLAQDPEMMRVHQEGGDFHSETAAVISTVFGEGMSAEHIAKHKNLPKDDPKSTYKLRYLGKKINHASAYRMGEFRQAEVINEESEETGIAVTVPQARQAQRLWRQQYFMMPDWWRRIERKLAQDRTLVTPYGRKRKFYGALQDSTFKEATGYVPQSTSVDYLNLGLLDVWEDLDRPGAYGIELLHQNHDSLLISVDEDRLDEAIPEILSCLSSGRTLVVAGHDISIPVEASFGPSWGEQTEWEG